jgi:glucose/arabinose dehydrogenase
LVRLTFDNGKPVPVEVLFEGAFGRIRDVDFFAEGNLYLLTDEDPGALFRVTPVR